MSDLFWLTDAQMAGLSPYFPKSHGTPRADDQRYLSQSASYRRHRHLLPMSDNITIQHLSNGGIAGALHTHVRIIIREIRAHGVGTLRW